MNNGTEKVDQTYIDLSIGKEHKLLMQSNHIYVSKCLLRIYPKADEGRN